MKKLLLCIVFFRFALPAQSYEAYNISLLAHMTPNIADQGFDGRRYSGCWGWYQQSKNKEYAIAGTSNGTYFYDVSTPTIPVLNAFVEGKHGCTYREIKTLDHYAYIISDDGEPHGLQIVDLQYLPDSVHVIYDGNQYFRRAHSIYIDGDKMYLGSTTFSTSFVSMSVFSLATPTAPLLLRTLNDDYPFIFTVHDMFVKNDTVYANSADQGLYIFRFDKVQGKFIQLGSYTGFPQAGYNHSSSLSSDGKSLVFCEEIPAGLPIRIVDVRNLSNIQAQSNFIPFQKTTPHNPFVKGNFALVSCYEDGLYIYDISNPYMVSKAGYFDTHNQGGANTGVYGAVNYRGNWGNYPFLPSGIVIANDMQNGIFILDATAAFTTTLKDYVGIGENSSGSLKLMVYPNPATDFINIRSSSNKITKITLSDFSGRVVLQKEIKAPADDIDIRHLGDGIYFLGYADDSRQIKLVIQHDR